MTLSSWKQLPVQRLDCSPEQLDLAHTLDCGQAFRWRSFPRNENPNREHSFPRSENPGSAGGQSPPLVGGAPPVDREWIGLVGGRVIRLWWDDALQCQVFPDGDASLVAAYLRLGVDLAALNVAGDARLAEAMRVFSGLRVLAQPALETLLTFVCSPASNIIRITRSIDILARLYGRRIATLDGQSYYAFPSLDALADTAPGELMASAGLGFRGARLRGVAAELLAWGRGWIDRLRDDSPDDARQALCALPGVGPKVADCAALFGLGHDDAVPVDTHVWAIARELFPGSIGDRTLTPATYQRVVEAYRVRYGRWAGWAQQYLYHARRVGRALPMPSRVSLPSSSARPNGQSGSSRRLAARLLSSSLPTNAQSGGRGA